MTAPSWHTLPAQRQRAVVELLLGLARQWREEARLEGAAKGASSELIAQVEEMAGEVEAAAARLDADSRPASALAPREHLGPSLHDSTAPSVTCVDGALDMRLEATLIEIGRDRRGRSVVRLQTRHGRMRVPLPVSHSYAESLARHLYEPVSVTVTITPRAERPEHQRRSP